MCRDDQRTIVSQLDIIAFVAEIDGCRYRMEMAGPSVSPEAESPAQMGREIELACRHLVSMMDDDPGLRHCDRGFACAKSLKDRYGARIWECKMERLPADATC